MTARYQKQNNGNPLIRNVAIVVALGALSFVLGFFVLAKLLPAGNNSNANNSSNLEAKNTPQTASVVTTTPIKAIPPSTSDTTKRAPSDASKPIIKPESGPLLVTEDPNAKATVSTEDTKPLQHSSEALTVEPKPTERSDARSQDVPKSDVTPKDNRTEQKSSPTSDEANSEKTAVNEEKKTTSPELPPTPKRRRHKKSRAVLSPLSPETNPESTETKVASASKTAAETLSDKTEKPTRKPRATADTTEKPATEALKTDTATNLKSTAKRLYRVQVNAYSTEAAAQHELDSLADRHIKARVRKVTREGKTLYSVQYGAYRNRDQAQAAQGKLKEQGVDSYVSQH